MKLENNMEECNNAIISQDYLDILVEYDNNLDEIIKKFNAECVQIINNKLAILHIKFESFYALLGIKQSNFPRAYGPYGKTSMAASGVLVFHTHPFVPLTGKGILIGIIDSGIDYTHRVFTYNDKTTKITSIWDQTIQGNPPEGFMYGTEYTRDDINRALRSEDPFKVVPSIDDSGHGTFLAGIAAGREVVEENFVGAAPGAELVIVKLKQAKDLVKEVLYAIYTDAIVYQSTDMFMGVKYLTQKALDLGRPLVIIVGLGANGYGHDGKALMEVYLSSIARRKENVVVVAAGNEANRKHHYKGEFENEDAYKEVELNVAENEEGLILSIWSRAPDILSIAITSPSGEYIDRVPIRLEETQVYNLILEDTQVVVVYQLSEERRGDQQITIRMANPTAGIWTITVFGDLIVNGVFHIWTSREGWIQEETQFLEADPYTTVTVPSTSIYLLTVGAYNHKTNSIYIDSGRGPTRYDKLKPNLVAPGVDVYGPLPGNRFGTMTGTSISASIVGGVSALLLEWGVLQGKDTEMDTQQVTNYLIRGASRNRSVDYPNPIWGFGELDLLNTFEAISGRKLD